MSASAPVLFLHTAPSNIDLFGRLLAEIDPSVPVRHELLESVLHGATGTGTLTDTMRRETEDAIRALAAAGARLIVCTCSTIGGVAESTAIDGPARVMRIDRPMAEAAVQSGRRILVAATLSSTVRPTVDLIEQVAADLGRQIEIVEVLCTDAWPHFQRGDHAAYAHAIADLVAAHAGVNDIVVPAQASMAPAEALLGSRGIHALSSPALGVRAAIAIYRQL